MRPLHVAMCLASLLSASVSTSAAQKPAATAAKPPVKQDVKKPAKPAPAAPSAASAAAPAPAGQPWLRWGGPTHDFIVPSTGLASSWPADGPPRLWSRTLGDGYSGISEENGILYTGYRSGSDDVITALDAQSGKTIWETKYAAKFTNSWSDGVGPGPYAMPQVIGDRIVTASGTGLIHSLDKKTGKIVWTHDLYNEFDGTQLGFGYSSHPLPYKDTLIVLVGGGGILSRFTGGGAIIAFKQRDGAIVWKANSFTNAHSSPMLINVDGQQQVVALLAAEVMGFDPNNGKMLWRHPHPTGNGLAISQPVWGPDNILFVSSAYGTGSRALELHQANGTTTVRELWASPRIQLHFGTAIRRGDFIYLSSGHSGPAFMTAVNVKTGQVAWQQRGFAKAQLLYADGKFVMVDEDGALALATATPENFSVLAKTYLLKRIAWTPPTLVGTRLYVRDRNTIVALDLGAPKTASR
jgi:outer membrane protein assembly factor BamB